jgi:predicted transcriptional regulator
VLDKVIIIEPLKSLTKSFLHQKFIEQGLSSQRIADEIGCSITTVKKYLKEYELKKGSGSGRHWNKLAYGEKIQKGRVVDHKSEKQILESIRRMYCDEGIGVSAIARILTSMNVPTKKQGKKWDHSVVTDILIRAGIYKPKGKGST